MYTISSLHARMILDSRGCPTVEVDLQLSDGSQGRASCPSGASTGSREAIEKRDGGNRFGGKGVSSVLQILHEVIKPVITGKQFASQRDFDTFLCTLDGTNNKIHLGANATLPLSLAYAKACAASKKLPLYAYLRTAFTFSKELGIPTPLINVLNGGKHAAASTDFQEWMIIPKKGDTFEDLLETASKVFYALRTSMQRKGLSGVGDEGGFPFIGATSNKEALLLLTQAVHEANLVPGTDIVFAIDVAASEFYNQNTYELSCDKKKLTSAQMIRYMTELTKDFPVVSIEDGLDENDWDGWKELTVQLGNNTQLVGDDLFTTNVNYIKRGIDTGTANTVLIKPNQIGTLTETVDAIEYAHANNMKTIISHRSGETEDVSIAHLAVASGAGQIKTGSLSRSERLAKYNELLRISEEVGKLYKPFS